MNTACPENASPALLSTGVTLQGGETPTGEVTM
jgi:hypothetical protein